MQTALVLLTVLAVAQVSRAEVTPAWAAEHLGVYLWPTYPRFEGFTLPEMLPIAENLGMQVARVPVEAHFGREASWVDVLRAPAMRRCLDRFPAVILTLSDHSGRQYEPEWTRAQYEAVTAYLLRTYRDTGKTFVLGLWESDHWLPLDEKGLAFLRARAEGIEQARKQEGEQGVRVLTMVEVTKASGDCVATKLLRDAPPEVVSLSWWAEANDVGGALRNLHALLPEARLMVGEMGLSNRRREPDRSAKLLAAIDDARGAGAEWVILWRLDDWEYGLVEAKAEGGRPTDLWPVIEPLFHGGRPWDTADWQPWGDGRRSEVLISDGSATMALPEGRWALGNLGFRTDPGARNVALTGDAGRVTLASDLPPQSAIRLSGDGSGVLQIGPVKANSPEDWQPWQAQGLVWNQEFAVWQPEARGSDGYLELVVQADFPILDGRLWLTGRRAPKGAWGVRIQGYDGEWIECPQVYDWRGEQLFARFPAVFPSEWGPTREISLRFWIRTDEESADWVWTTSITSVRATLDLDTRSASWPEGPALQWSAEGEGWAEVTVRAPRGGQ